MKEDIFIRHKTDNPHLTFKLISKNNIPIEKTWFDDYAIYQVFERSLYEKSNGKKCYVDIFLKEIKVQKNMVAPCKSGIGFKIKNKYIKSLI